MEETTMKALVYEKYGSPDVLELREIDRPLVTDDGVLVRVHAFSVNPVDWHTLTGTPYMVRLQAGLLKPKREVLGVDFAGTVEAVGGDVKKFQPGDEVFGGRSGAFAEYVCVPEDRAVVLKPANVTFEQAASVPVAAVSALQGLRDKGRIQRGQRVLINGASGGVGTFAVQIAKSFGAEVTGVCSTGNVDIARSIGADHVIDYTREDFTLSKQRYDVMLDIAGNRSWSESRRVLNEKASLVVVGGPKTNRWIGPLSQLVKLRLASLGGSRRVVPFLAKINREDLEVLQELLESATVTPVIDRRYELSEGPEALRYLGDGHAQGKVVINVLGSVSPELERARHPSSG
jgi:NADPH:quinone reductase-like Zn-dependent oxidoreductase